jgi:GDP-D-mannose dehydratase
MLRQSHALTAEEFDILDHSRLLSFVSQAEPDAIVHLAAQAGVRYSWSTRGPTSTPTSPARST